MKLFKIEYCYCAHHGVLKNILSIQISKYGTKYYCNCIACCLTTMNFSVYAEGGRSFKRYNINA
jgi:hypothetical protein